MSRDPVPPLLEGAAAPGGAQPTCDLSQPEPASVPPAVRAQLLATEHWSLLATRSTAQSEVLSRISTFLMLVSSSIVSLALVGQFTRFDGRFIAFALILLGGLVVIGTLAQMRVGNASIEDLAHVIGMNRLRAAYVELDPAIERRRGGAQRTWPGRRRGDSSGRSVVSCDLPDAWVAAVQVDKRAHRPVPSTPFAHLHSPWLAAKLDQSRPANLLFELLTK